MIVSMICAMAENRGIGYKNTLPWKLSNDLQHFKALTIGKPIIMGRKTFDSIGKPLPGRKNIILSRNKDLKVEGCEVFQSFDDIKNACKDEEEICIIGGDQIYQLLFDYADTLHLTQIHAEIVADAFFPDFDQSQWEQISCEKHSADRRNDYDYSFTTLKKKAL